MPLDIDQARIDVALGRRVMVLGDLLLPPEPSPSSLATCRDIAQALDEWQGPGVVVVCGQLVTAGLGAAPGSAAAALRAHVGLTDAFAAFAAAPRFAGDRGRRAGAPARRPGRPSSVRLGVSLEAAADLHCMTGAGERHVLIRAGTPDTDTTHASDAVAPGDERPWLNGMERLDDPRQAPRFVRSRLLYRRMRHYLWAPPLILAALALSLRLEVVIDGLGHVFRSPRQQRALQHAYNATWFSRLLVTIAIGVVLLAVLAVVVAVTSRGIWRALGGEGLPSPWSAEGARTPGQAGHGARAPHASKARTSST